MLGDTIVDSYFLNEGEICSPNQLSKLVSAAASEGNVDEASIAVKPSLALDKVPRLIISSKVVVI
ncbi:MAG: hypothetical protein AAF734_00750 [Bacteroidota bacterium]